MGFAARSTVLAYNTDKVQESELPDSIMELAEPKWKGRVSFSPDRRGLPGDRLGSGRTRGREAAAKTWLEGLKANGTVYQGNNVVLKSVNDGQTDTGIIYHYYWYRDQEESGASSDNTALHYFGDQDPGAFLSVSGAGVLKSSDHPKEAQQFVEVPQRHQGPDGARRELCAGVPAEPRRGPPGDQAAGRARAARGRCLRTQRPRGHRDDAAGRPALSTVREPRHRGRPREAPAPAGRCRHGGRAAGAGAARFVVVYTAVIGLDEPWGCSCGRGSVCCCTTRPADRVHAATSVIGVAAAWLVERSDLPGPAALARAACRAAGRARVREQLRLGVAPRGRGVRRSAAHRHPVVLPARVPAGGGDAARAGPRPGGDGAVPRPRAWAIFRVVVPQLRPALLGGGLLVGLHLLAEFGALQMLRFPTFTTAIYDQYRSRSTGRPPT